jgi:hypothetical protein
MYLSSIYDIIMLLHKTKLGHFDERSYEMIRRRKAFTGTLARLGMGIRVPMFYLNPFK